MKLSTKAQQLVENNLGLVYKVLDDCGIGVATGIYAREDLFQIGSIGLCKAAAGYQPGKAAFATYAYVCIRNEIYDALKYSTLRAESQTELRAEMIPNSCDAAASASQYQSLRELLENESKQRTGTTARGIRALLLHHDGYSYREIGNLYKVPENHVRAWVARARTCLKLLAKDFI